MKVMWTIDNIQYTRYSPPKLIDWLAHWFWISDSIVWVRARTYNKQRSAVHTVLFSHFRYNSLMCSMYLQCVLPPTIFSSIGYDWVCVHVSANDLYEEKHFRWTETRAHSHTFRHSQIRSWLTLGCVYIWQSDISNQIAHQYQLFQVNWLANRKLRRRQSINRI